MGLNIFRKVHRDLKPSSAVRPYRPILAIAVVTGVAFIIVFSRFIFPAGEEPPSYMAFDKEQWVSSSSNSLDSVRFRMRSSAIANIRIGSTATMVKTKLGKPDLVISTPYSLDPFEPAGASDVQTGDGEQILRYLLGVDSRSGSEWRYYLDVIVFGSRVNQMSLDIE